VAQIRQDSNNMKSSRNPSIQLTEALMLKLGLTCLWLDRVTYGLEGKVRVLKRTIAGRIATGEKIWFRSDREATRIYDAVFSRCLKARKGRDGMVIELSHDEVAKLIRDVSFSLGVTPIQDEDVATTFDSIRARADAAMARLKREGELKKLNAGYRDVMRSREQKAKTEANRQAYEVALAIYSDLPRDRRDAVKAEYEMAKLTDPKLAWGAFLRLKFPVTDTASVTLVPDEAGTIDGTIAGTSGTFGTTYSDWLVERLKVELSQCPELVRITRL
jgi:hypothetical protein